MRSRDTILDVRNLRTEFATEGGILPAVDDVSFSLSPGETLGLVGESGCGKSVTSFSLMRLVASPGRIVGGEVILEGKDLLKLPTRELLDVRGKRISMIFQDPADSLNPTVSIGEQVMEALDHKYYDAWRGGWIKGIAAWVKRKLGSDRSARKALRKSAVDLLAQMGIPDPERRFHEYPYMLSGGLLQRCMIAIALASRPALLIADEPTTALDVTIQAQILDLLRQRQRDFGVSIVLITHDLGVVSEMCDRVAVMYAGRVVEQGIVEQIFKNPRHPYTAALLRSVPRMEARKGPLPAIDGTVPNLIGLDKNSCYFVDRCAKAMPRCREIQPRMLKLSADEFVACHLYDEETHSLSSRQKKQGRGKVQARRMQ
jgi:oligopeptide/dipeptide ABC transporter ATP-binding protein